MNDIDKTRTEKNFNLSNKDQRAAQSKTPEDFSHGKTKFSASIFINSPIGIYIVQDEKFRFVNPEFQKITGYREDELLGTESQRMVFPEDWNMVRENAVKMLKGESYSPYVYRAVHKKGEIRCAIETVTSIQYDGKRATLGYFMDNTRLKRTEQALRQSEAQKQAILDGITTSLIYFNEDKEILWANNAAANSVNKTPEEIIGRTCHELCTDLKSLCDNCPAEKAFRTRTTEQTIIHSPDGKIWNTKAEPVFDDKKNLTGVIKIAHDITEKSRLADQLKHAQKMESLGTLAGGVAHDFNNILSIIMNYAQIALFQIPETHNEALQSIDHIKTASRRAKDMVDQILSFSRQTEIEKKPVKVQLIIESALEFIRASLPSTVEIVQNIDTETSTIMGDSTQIQQIIMNLCTNAHHAMGAKGGLLEVTLSRVEANRDSDPALAELKPGHYLHLCISDTGCGMNDATVKRIFDPYFTTKEKGTGTGMGLAVVHGIVKNHGGTIRVYSEPGKGSTFHVYLPMIQSEAKPAAKAIESFPRGIDRILFVDDEEEITVSGKKILELLGYEVTASTNPVEALETYRANPDNFDLVITDMGMPIMTGEMLAKELMNIRPDLPIILCTGYSEELSEKRAKELGIKEFAMKPLEIRDLANTVRKVLDRNKT
ncbi:MAG: PAS domain S-box protein [Deltaproteobacteria bacterium]|nr:PAS domain S-box protein [Deltaproteobacteria bacterium]